jgi:hypothetical protein
MPPHNATYWSSRRLMGEREPTRLVACNQRAMIVTLCGCGRCSALIVVHRIPRNR